MNVFVKLAAAIAMLATAVTASAESDLLDIDPMINCGGTIELREAANGDLAIKFEGNRYCNTLRIYDYSSNKTIKTYSNLGSSYTLSKAQRESLSDDCRVGLDISGSWGTDRFNVVLNRCLAARKPVQKTSIYSYQLSNKGNCKLFIRGEYSNTNVADSYCQGLTGDQVGSYELSNNGNCKLMVNGLFSQKLVSNVFCSARH